LPAPKLTREVQDSGEVARAGQIDSQLAQLYAEFDARDAGMRRLKMSATVSLSPVA
jgi:hypothetical protein